MVVFLTGASGFIGRAVDEALRAAGHRVIAAVHRRPVAGNATVAVDYTTDFDPAVWRARLLGVDAVINAVGLIRERGALTFDAVHVRAPRALFAAAAEAGVRRVIQLSALGADEAAASPYHISKRRADDFLAAMPVSAAIVQPSLVYGRAGSSAALFNTLASLPLVPLPAGGLQLVQPIHIDDLVAAITALLDRDAWRVGRLALVGPEPVTLRAYLGALRAGMGLPAAHTISIPRALMRVAARVGDRLPSLLLDRATLAMLERGNTADAGVTRQLLGREPRAPNQFIAPADRHLLAAAAKLAWLRPLLRVAVAVMWIVTAIVSVAVYPVADSYAMLAATGISARFAPVALYGAAAVDLLLGIGSLLVRRRWIWWSQIALIIGYTAVISWHLPEYWSHPFGPILKNVPIVAALLVLAELEER